MTFQQACALFAVSAAAFTTTARADHLTNYPVSLGALNNSGVSASGLLTVDTNANTLQVVLNVIGLEINQDHILHIHGLINTDGSPGDSMSPTLADDTDGDGFIEVLEGVPNYGDILLPLGIINTPTGDFNYDMTFSLADDSQFMSPVTGNQYAASDIFPLTFREVVIHGLTVAADPTNMTGGEVDGTPGYKVVLPVASGEVVPEPSSIILIGILGLSLGGLRRNR